MNPDARKFFQDNPTERYWYYSKSIRIPNPRMKMRPPYDSWPKER